MKTLSSSNMSNKFSLSLTVEERILINRTSIGVSWKENKYWVNSKDDNRQWLHLIAAFINRDNSGGSWLVITDQQSLNCLLCYRHSINCKQNIPVPETPRDVCRATSNYFCHFYSLQNNSYLQVNAWQLFVSIWVSIWKYCKNVNDLDRAFEWSVFNLMWICRFR